MADIFGRKEHYFDEIMNKKKLASIVELKKREKNRVLTVRRFGRIKPVNYALALRKKALQNALFTKALPVRCVPMLYI